MSHLDIEAARELSERLKLFAQPQRLMILSLLLDGPLAVSDIESRTGIGQPTLSQQLGVLRRADVVAARRESRAIHYGFTDAAQADRARAFLNLLQERQTAIAAPASMATPSPKPQPDNEGGAHFARVRTVSSRTD